MAKKKINTIKPVFYHCDYWEMNYWICVGWDANHFEEYVLNELDYKIDLSSKDGVSLFFENQKDGQMISVIWTREIKQSVIAHKCCYAAFDTLKKRNTPLNDSTHEFYCYLVERLVKIACNEEK